VLVRFYKTHNYAALEPAQQRFAAAQLGAIPPRDDMRCLALLATIGDEPEWCSRHTSRTHAVIPLPSAERVRSAPMIMRLLEELGEEVESLSRDHIPVRSAARFRTIALDVRSALFTFDEARTWQAEQTARLPVRAELARPS
jgi:hypothetical protein